MVRARLALACVMAAAGCAVLRPRAYEQTYLRAPSNWAFRSRFPRVDHLFNGFDYGHAILYETLLSPRDASARLEGDQFRFITTKLLRDPPAVPLDEAAIGPEYAKLIPEVVEMFDWAHMLHRQLYDVWAQYGDLPSNRDAQVATLLAFYRSRPDLAFSTTPKSMMLMEGQPYSLAFRTRDPKFNGLLWSYHWLQMSLYDALLSGGRDADVDARVDSTVRTFFHMLDDAPSRMPAEMPMSADAAPLFTARYPEAAAIFDNLHSLHDVVSDILASDVVPRSRKRAAILAAAAAYRDDARSRRH